MTMKRWLSELQKLVDELGGGTIERTRGDHLMIRLSRGGPPVYTASTPSDYRAIDNTRRDLRRALRRRTS